MLLSWLEGKIKNIHVHVQVYGIFNVTESGDCFRNWWKFKLVSSILISMLIILKQHTTVVPDVIFYMTKSLIEYSRSIY